MRTSLRNEQRRELCKLLIRIGIRPQKNPESGLSDPSQERNDEMFRLAGLGPQTNRFEGPENDAAASLNV